MIFAFQLRGPTGGVQVESLAARLDSCGFLSRSSLEPWVAMSAAELVISVISMFFPKALEPTSQKRNGYPFAFPTIARARCSTSVASLGSRLRSKAGIYCGTDLENVFFCW